MISNKTVKGSALTTLGLFFREKNMHFYERKEEFVMKQSVKYVAVALAGYLVGVYEMKYKVVKAIADEHIKQKDQEDSKEDTKEEA